LGLVLGEVLSEEEAVGRIREPLTASACESVLSFALVRELALHKDITIDDGDLLGAGPALAN